MWAFGASSLATANRLLSHADVWLGAGLDRIGCFELGSSEDLETSQIVFVEISDRIKEITVERHQATCTGAKRRVIVRRSVSVHP